MSVGTNIKLRRLSMKMTQQELADALGYTSRSTIAKIESGENEVSSSKLGKIAEVLDTTPAFFLDDKERNTAEAIIPQTNGRKNLAVILAGGKSTRNEQIIPNQFISVLNKPIIIYCMEKYQNHPAIDEIYAVCLKGWEDILRTYAKQYGITKLTKIVPAGASAILSARNALNAALDYYTPEDVIIIQEATRPFVSVDLISTLLNNAKSTGNAITCEAMSEILQFDISSDKEMLLNKQGIIAAQAPEAYRIGVLEDAFKKAAKSKIRLNESCCYMLLYRLGEKLHFFKGNRNNLKIVRQEDIILFTALAKAGYC